MQERTSRRNAVLGGITITAIIISFALALRARDRVDVPVVIVAPVGTAVELDGDEPRVLPPQPNTPSTLASFYFLTEAGEHEVRFQERGGAARTQAITVRASRMPVIYTLLRDTLREMRERTP
jgi:hypothetical protein